MVSTCGDSKLKVVLSSAAVACLALLGAVLFLTTPASAQPSFSASATTVSVPEGPGSIEGMGEEFDVSPNTGLSSYSLGMPVPPGPGGLTPSVKLSYSSGAPNGPLGVGWSMGAGRLCRTTDAGMPAYGGRENGDAFMLQGAVGAGELVDVPEWDDGWMGFREEGAFVRARPDQEAGDGEGWTVQAPDGSVYRFGTTEGSREGPGAESGAASFDDTFCWTLTRKEDVWGHRVDYHYTRDGGRLYLEEIRYVLGNWQAGYERVFAQRLREIQTVVSRCA